MALFQKSIVEKYLRTLDDAVIEKAFENYSTVYVPKINRIKELKEEQYQTQFLQDIFGSVLGYTVDPEEGFNIELEKKNEKDSKKVDGAILKDDSVLGVIELKSTKTTDLEKVKDQAFGYKNNHKGCKYVISSNFHKLRFYVDDATEYEEFDLFNLSKTEFRKFYLYLRKEGLLDKDVPKQLKEETKFHEENISKQLYKDYSTFKNRFFENLVKNNPQHDKLILFKKSQKFLDRILFALFAEDKDLIPENAISRIVESWAQADDLHYKPLYDLFKIFFEHLNVGHKYKSGYEIPAYNGGLFAPDEILDNTIVDDEVLKDDLLILSKYDFNSEVDVNILGHIFEHSLSEIEEVEAELRGEVSDKSKSKRKKDGVFYTPKYITKYIVDNTVGKLCIEKRDELGVIDEEYAKGRRNRKKETIQTLSKNLEEYRKWLLNITICDPACGSGAFLNQALEFLIKEHQYIDALESQLLESPIVFNWVEDHILEKNLFGVDINEESVEIARLSLWLRTAKKGRKLTALNNNIKCGNSLIDNSEVAGDKAFNWQQEFPNVFGKGGFDVIIGNPPYVDIKGLDNELVKELFKVYSTSENRINLYSIFIEKGFEIVKEKGFLSFINPNSILVNSSYTKIRKLLIDDMTTIVKLPDHVFEDATVETIIFEFRKNAACNELSSIVYQKDEKIQHVDNLRIKRINKEDWKQSDGWNFNIYVNPDQSRILKKITFNSIDLQEIADFTLGITPYDKYKGHSAELIRSKGFHSDTKDSEEYKPLISGGNINRHHVSEVNNGYIKYGDWLGAPREERFFTEPRVLVRQIVSGNPPRIYAGFTDKPLYYTQIGFGIIPKPNTISVKSLLAVINSTLINFFHKYSFLDLEKELFQKILIANCKKFPFKKALLEKESYFDQIIDQILSLKENEVSIIRNFINLIKSKFPGLSISKKLQSWNSLEFDEFLKELEKLRSTAAKENETDYDKLSLSEEARWMQYFNEEKQKAQELKQQINQTDKEIDQLVYELYGLTEEEIKIVEES